MSKVATALYLSIYALLAPSMLAQKAPPSGRTTIAEGWHPWYEIKADPQDSQKLIICGTRWDAQSNAALGFVYASSDGGRTWQSVLEDRHTSWVTEQSCAFGPMHMAYFIAEASKVIDGEAHHDLGTTRLYVSPDDGQHWAETIQTGWADYSTSAVSSTSGRFYTFFNIIADEPGRIRGSNVGLLVFSPDGKVVAGPFFDSALTDFSYEGSFPSNATALRNGVVVALYYGTRRTPSGAEGDLGIIRADQSPQPSVESIPIIHTVADKDCFSLDNSSLAYDAERNRLFVLYAAGCKNMRIMLTSSDDEGKTWTQAVVLNEPDNPIRKLTDPSLLAGPGGILGLLWKEGQFSGRWFFSHIRNQKLIELPMELPGGRENGQVSNDSLLTWVYQPNGHRGQGGDPNTPSEPAIRLNVGSALNVVWRASGLTIAGDKVLAVWPSGDSGGMRLYSEALSPVGIASQAGNSTPTKDASDPDVTSQTVILYGGSQHFDSATSTLEVCLALGNRGTKPLRVPIKLEAEDIRSGAGVVSVLKASNGLAGVGAVWDISNSVTGNQIPPLGDSNPFCLSFHIEMPRKGASTPEAPDLLNLKIRVLAAADTSSEKRK